MQIYGIDLAKEKFDVSFLRQSAKSAVAAPVHKVVSNTESSIRTFLKSVPAGYYICKKNKRDKISLIT